MVDSYGYDSYGSTYGYDYGNMLRVLRAPIKLRLRLRLGCSCDIRPRLRLRLRLTAGRRLIMSSLSHGKATTHGSDFSWTTTKVTAKTYLRQLLITIKTHSSTVLATVTDVTYGDLRLPNCGK
jgi:hypothetical protein